MLLPGQSKQASSKLQKAVEEVESGLKRRLLFLPIEQNPDPLLGAMMQGYHESRDGEELIWLDTRLPYAALEATTAHELGHVMQRKEGYPQVFSLADSRGKPRIKALERLAARANNLVMDESADLWAIAHGFDIGQALGHLGLDQLIARIKGQPLKAEAGDWKSYFAAWEKLKQDVAAGKRINSGFEAGYEANTQAMALDYAGLSLRLGRYGLFDSLDNLWSQRWPISKDMGKELAAIVTHNGVTDREKCLKSLQKITAFLKIPAPLLSVR